MAEPTMADIARRLDLILGTIQLAHWDAIHAAREDLLSDPVSKAVYDLADEWIGAGDLVISVSASTGAASRTVSRRVADLAARNVLEVSGATSSTKYRRTGLL